jgi:hypothetical protein
VTPVQPSTSGNTTQLTAPTHDPAVRFKFGMEKGSAHAPTRRVECWRVGTAPRLRSYCLGAGLTVVLAMDQAREKLQLLRAFRHPWNSSEFVESTRGDSERRIVR